MTMQAPKDGDSAVSDVRTCQDRGEPAETFVTRNCSEAGAAALSGAFMRGFVDGLAPLGMDAVRVDSRVNADVTTYRMGDASASVSGLELLQCLSPELLGRVKGAELREAFHAKHPVKGSGVVWAPLPEDTVPMPQVLAWSGGGSPEGLYGRVTIGIEGREVAYVPETTRGNDIKPEMLPGFDEWLQQRRAWQRLPPDEPQGFDAWLQNPYTKVLLRSIEQSDAARNRCDGMLSLVLHELAGSASLCWEPKPAGTFDSEEALQHVEAAIGKLRTSLRVNI